MRSPSSLASVSNVIRKNGGWVVSTHFTLVPGIGGEPIISDHLKELRPFLRKGDFATGSFGHALIDELAPADFSIEKVAFSAFYMSRLEWVLNQVGINRLIVGGIVTNGGVTSTVRDAHVRGYDTWVLSDGCATFDADVHAVSIEALKSVARITTLGQAEIEPNDVASFFGEFLGKRTAKHAIVPVIRMLRGLSVIECLPNGVMR